MGPVRVTGRRCGRSRWTGTDSPTYSTDSRYRGPVTNGTDGRIPARRGQRGVADMFTRYRVAHVCRPAAPETQIDAWAGEARRDTVVQWPTNFDHSHVPRAGPLPRGHGKALSTHDDDPTYRSHALAARRSPEAGRQVHPRQSQASIRRSTSSWRTSSPTRHEPTPSRYWTA